MFVWLAGAAVLVGSLVAGAGPVSAAAPTHCTRAALKIPADDVLTIKHLACRAGYAIGVGIGYPRSSGPTDENIAFAVFKEAGHRWKMVSLDDGSAAAGDAKAAGVPPGVFKSLMKTDKQKVSFDPYLPASSPYQPPLQPGSYVLVPNIVGMPFYLAYDKIAAVGLRLSGDMLVQSQSQYPVYGQTPAAGTKEWVGSVVTAQTVTQVADVVGLTYSQAVQRLRADSLTIQVVGDTTGPYVTVAAQSIPGGSTVREHATIRLTTTDAATAGS